MLEIKEITIEKIISFVHILYLQIVTIKRICKLLHYALCNFCIYKNFGGIVAKDSRRNRICSFKILRTISRNLIFFTAHPAKYTLKTFARNEPGERIPPKKVLFR